MAIVTNSRERQQAPVVDHLLLDPHALSAADVSTDDRAECRRGDERGDQRRDAHHSTPSSRPPAPAASIRRRASERTHATATTEEMLLAMSVHASVPAESSPNAI
jgi:hypothetical protein